MSEDSDSTKTEYRAEVHRLLEIADPTAAWRYGICGQEGYGWWYHCPENDQHYAAYHPARCMQRICPECSDYMADNVRDKYRPVIAHVARRERRGWSLKLITLTRSVKLGAALGPVACDTLDAVRDLYHRLWGESEGAGLIACLEVGERGQKFHVHAIVWGPFFWESESLERIYRWQRDPRCQLAVWALLGAGLYSQALSLWMHPASCVAISGGPYISEEWKQLTGDYVVKANQVTPDVAVREGLKYITKFVDLSPSQMVALHTALKGTRRIRSYGVFYNPDFETETEAAITQCPECNAPLKYTSELMFEEWRLENAARRRDIEMNLIAAMTQRLRAASLQFIESNKYLYDTGPPGQISLFDSLDSALDDALGGRRAGKFADRG